MNDMFLCCRLFDVRKTKKWSAAHKKCPFSQVYWNFTDPKPQFVCDPGKGCAFATTGALGWVLAVVTLVLIVIVLARRKHCGRR
jgi:hypothetical protein